MRYFIKLITLRSEVPAGGGQASPPLAAFKGGDAAAFLFADTSHLNTAIGACIRAGKGSEVSCLK